MYRPAERTGNESVDRELLRLQQTLSDTKFRPLTTLYKEPEKPREGMTAICDGTEWDPLGDGIKQPVWFDGTSWQPLGGSTSFGLGIDGGAPTTVFGGSSLDGGSP